VGNRCFKEKTWNSGSSTQPASRRNACKKAIIERALRKTGRDRAKAARLLDLNPNYFSALCQELNVK